MESVVGRLDSHPPGLLDPGTLLRGVGGQVGGDQYQPAADHRVRGALGCPGNAGQPAACCRVVLEVRQIPDAQVEGDNDRLVVPARLAQQREGTLPVADRGTYIAQPPARPALAL